MIDYWYHYIILNSRLACVSNKCFYLFESVIIFRNYIVEWIQTNGHNRTKFMTKSLKNPALKRKCRNPTLMLIVMHLFRGATKTLNLREVYGNLYLVLELQ